MSTGPIVLLHGLGVDHRMWELQTPSLQILGQVFAPDLPGFGAEPPVEPLSRRPDLYSDWVARRIRCRWPGKRVSVAGYSMGGTVALMLALRHPDLIARVVVACSPPRWVGGWRRLLPLFLKGPAAAPAMELFQRVVLLRLRQLGLGPTFLPAARDMVRAAHRPTMVALCRALCRIDLRPFLATVNAPALVVGGTRDPWLSVREARGLAQALPHGRLHIVPRAGHLLCLSRAAAFTDVLVEFFSARGADI